MERKHHFSLGPGIALLLTDLGVDAGLVLRRAGLPEDLFSRAPVSLPPEDYFGLLTALEQEAEDPLLPLSIGRAMTVEVFDPPVFAGMCSPNLRVAAERIAQYKRLMGPVRLDVSRGKQELTLRYEWPMELTPPTLLEAIEVVFWVSLARLGTRSPIRPQRVAMANPPQDLAAYHRDLGVWIEKGEGPTLTFSASDADRPFLTSRSRMWEVFEPELRQRLSELEAGSSTEERVSSALLELLPAGTASIGSTARRLAMSTRTLQRRLRQEGTSFQSVLDATRERLARHYLNDPGISTSEVSFLLGYEDVTSFYRAFRGWTGETPERVRRA